LLAPQQKATARPASAAARRARNGRIDRYELSKDDFPAGKDELGRQAGRPGTPSRRTSRHTRDIGRIWSIL
jgi:hypothetical protein